MKVFSSIKDSFVLFHIFLTFNLISSQINDNYISDVLEEGNYDLLDVTDYHGINLIVSTSGNIYTGIPPLKKVETNANLIKVSSLITINDNYLLAACLGDSFLGKINLSTGTFNSLLTYEEIDISPKLEIPKAICSLSNIENNVFIGYSRIEEDIDNDFTTNIIFKINIDNIGLIEEGPSLDNSAEKKIFSYSRVKKETSSLRQISCEPIKILEDPNDDYRLICLHESISIFIINDVPFDHYDVFAASINSNFDNFEISSKEYTIDDGNRALGFRIFRENDYYAKVLTGNSLFQIYLEKATSGVRIKDSYLLSSTYNLKAEIDLISYNNKFTFSAMKTSFMGKNDIYCFKIYQFDYSNYFELCNYQENNIEKILGYHNEDTNKIILIYQTNNNIKYFIMDNIIDIYALTSYSDSIELGSYYETQYDLNDLVTTPSLNTLGKLNVDYISYKITSFTSENEYFGIDFYETLMSNNILIPEPSLNDWKTYYLSFIDNVENEYTRIYHIKSLNIKIKTCKENCYSCWDGYESCTDCSDSQYAILIDRTNECFPPSYIVDGYIYDSLTNKFLKCFESCEFCSEASENSSEQKCTSCLLGYLYSYSYLGNCYLYTGLTIIESKEVDPENDIYMSSSCNKFKISSTGECVNECPTSSPYFKYEYNEETSLYEKVFYNPPKFLFNNICYEQCPENSSPDSNNECICNNYFYKNNIGDIVCLPDDNCINEYSFLNEDTKECFDSLEKCSYFFGDICYNDDCPNNKVLLETQSENVKNYIKEKLSLNNNLINKICICDTSNGVWSNIDAEKEYYQTCLDSCPPGYIPEGITKQCILEDIDISTNIISTSSNSIEFYTNNIYLGHSYIETPPLTVINEETEIELNYRTQYKSTQVINETDINPQIEKSPDCPAEYENRCYMECPKGTCLTQEDHDLKTCENIRDGMKVFNGICFDNFMEIVQNIKIMSQNGQTIFTNSGIIIHGYSTKCNKEEDKNSNYSFVNLGDCEYN